MKKRRILCVVLTLAMVLSMLVIVPAVSASAADTYNASDNPVRISTTADLKAFRNAVNAGTDFTDKTVKLEADIDISDSDWTPIGTWANPFKGTFDGQGRTIRGLNQVRGGAIGGNVGLFGVVSANSTSTIRNFQLEGNIVGQNGGNDAGTVISVVMPKSGSNITVYISGIASKVHFDCSNAAMKGVGGILGSIGYVSATSTKTIVQVERCWFDGLLDSPSAGSNCYGGIVGWTRELPSSKTLRVADCLVTGTLKLYGSNPDDCGGIVGFFKGTGATNGAVLTGYVRNCIFAGTIHHVNLTSGTARSGYITSEVSASGISPNIEFKNCYYRPQYIGAQPAGWLGYPSQTTCVTETNVVSRSEAQIKAMTNGFTDNAKWHFSGGSDWPYPVSVYNAYVAALNSYPEYPACIKRDSLYSVTVERGIKKVPLVVYNQAAEYSHFQWDGSSGRAMGAMDSNRRFCEFYFDDAPVTVKIKVNKNFNSYVVSPTSKGFASTYNNGVISVTLNQPEQFVVILDDDYNTAIAVFADAPETDVPTKGASNVVYVEGDNQITAPAGQVSYAGLNNEVMVVHGDWTKIYLAPGAVLKKRIFISRTQNNGNGYATKIYGRGAILDPFSDPTANSKQSIMLEDCYDPSTGKTKSYDAMKAVINIYSYTCTVKDIKLLDARNYNVYFAQSGCTADNVKLLSTEMCTDGFTCCQDQTVRNCFVYNGDNALVMQYGTTAGHTYENVTIGTTCAAIYPQYGCNATLTNIYVFRADDGLINVYENNIGELDVHVNGLDALDCVKTPTLFHAKNSPGSATKSFTLTNVAMRFTTGNNGDFTPGTNTSSKTSIWNVNGSNCTNFVLDLTNLYMGGHLVDGVNAYLKGNNEYSPGNYNYYSTSYPESNGVAIDFKIDYGNLPAHTSVPTAQTANYTGAASYTPSTIRNDWNRYVSYNCTAIKQSNGKYEVNIKSGKEGTHEWGISYNLTEYFRLNGPGTYSFSYSTNKSVKWYEVATSNVNGTSANVNGSAASKTIVITVTAETIKDYTWQIVLKAPNGNTNSFILNSYSIVKTA